MAIAPGETNLFFSRDTKVYIEQNGSIWEIPVLDGYSYNQDTNKSEVTLSEMSNAQGVNRRGKKAFTDSYAPAEWSLSTYVRPFSSGASGSTSMHAIEEALWANFVAQNSFDGTSWENGLTSSSASLDIDFIQSNKVVLGTFNLYYVLGASSVPGANYTNSGDTTIYKINNAVVNEASMTFEVDGIAMIAWSGFGGLLEEITAFDASGAIRSGIDSTDNFIRQRMTQLAISSAVSGTMKTYDITLTGGSITINNGITYLTPELLGVVNQPIGHITGTRSVSGSFTAYLDEKANSSIDLFDDISRATKVITNKFALDFYVGGKSGTDSPTPPGLQFKIPQAHLELPSFDASDVFAVEVAFDALPSTIGGTNEIERISYVGT